MTGLDDPRTDDRAEPRRVRLAWVEPPDRVGFGSLVALMVANTVAAVGLAGDIASHVSFAVTLDDDDFLSGWHLVLYSGIAGAAVVIGLLAVQRDPRAPVRMLPTATAGVATLTVGGAADAIWHEVFGVEAALQALVSPPHLLIFMGLVLLMVAPIGALADGPNRPLDPVHSLVLALSVTSLLLVISLFTGYLTPLIGGSQFQAGAYTEPLIGTSLLDYDISRSLGVALWFSVLMSVVVVGIRARTAPVAGTWTVSFGLLGLAPPLAALSSPTGSSTWTGPLPLTAALVTYGLLSDLTATRARPHPAATGVAVAAMWTVMFLLVGARGDLVWVRELWAGIITTGFLVGGTVGAVARWLSAAPRDG